MKLFLFCFVVTSSLAIFMMCSCPRNYVMTSDSCVKRGSSLISDSDLERSPPAWKSPL